jgi:hypothetical protein
VVTAPLADPKEQHTIVAVSSPAAPALVIRNDLDTLVSYLYWTVCTVMVQTANCGGIEE